MFFHSDQGSHRLKVTMSESGMIYIYLKTVISTRKKKKKQTVFVLHHWDLDITFIAVSIAYPDYTVRKFILFYLLRLGNKSLKKNLKS